MKQRFLIILLTVIMGVPLFPGSEEVAVICASNGTTYYIRTDGGTASQCTGTTDAPYSGSGVNQPCAWSHPYWALDGSGNWKITGGDTLIIAAGEYMLGYGAPNTQGWCDESYTYDCHLPPLPSGPDASHPTRILGKGWDTGCPHPPELWGTQRIWQVLDLTGSSNVYIGCLELTDHSDCVENHANHSVECERDTYPYGPWASDGLVASDSDHVTLKNLDIHGLAGNGVRAGRISNWTVEDVRIAANGWAGWDGDLPDENDANSGTLTFTRFTVEWNGCGETYPGKQPHNCWSQTAGGYGDGFGTGATGGHWLFQDSIFRYNTSDGLDLLYVRENGSRIDIKRTISYGNAGNAVKTNGDVAVENCVLIGNCGYFSGQSFTYNVDDCRALGSTFVFSLRNGVTVSLINSTVVGQGDCLTGGECDTENSSCDGSETIIMQNNIFQGYPEFQNTWDTACYLWLDRFNYYNLQMDYNIVYNAKIADQVSLSVHDIQKDPLFVNDGLGAFDGHLQSGSPAIDSGLAVGSLGGLVPVIDVESNNRPVGSGVDRGAYEYGSSNGGGGGGGGGGTSVPFGSFDTPLAGAVVRSSIPVSGWALDDVGVQSVKIYRGEGGELVYIGDADFVEGARPDVEAAYPNYPNNSSAGWGYMLLTNFLPNSGNGTYTLAAVARDSDGNTITLGTRTITADNAHAVKPFGAIDTPTQGGTAAGGSFINWGWVLTPQPNSIATDGSTINVWVDGANLGHPTYNIYREDIASFFPGYVNSSGAVGYFYLDTTAYTDGVHAIQWTATDSGGNTDGIGSRYFTIDNSSLNRPQPAVSVFSDPCPEFGEKPVDRTRPVRVGTGFGKGDSREIYPEKDGIIRIGIKVLERLEIRLADGETDSTFGIRRTKSQKPPLPIGSAFTGGVFCWIPGPAFRGEHRLEFLRTNANGETDVVTILVTIAPF